MNTNRRIHKNKLFPLFDNNVSIYDKLMIDEDVLSFVSVPEDSAKISQIILQHCDEAKIDKNNCVVTDANSCIGGNVFSFAKIFKAVNAIEIDAKNFRYLSNNVNVYKFNNVSVYNDDCLNLIYNLTQDVIFFDPPWGGSNYKDKTSIRLQLSNTSLEDICNKLIENNNTKMIVLKIPKNYDVSYLYQMVSVDKIKIYSYDIKKMNIIVIVNKF